MEPLNTNYTAGTNYTDGSYGGTVQSSVERESWKEMVQHLYADINTLWQKESLLVRTELNEKVTDIKVAAGSFAIAGGLLFVGLISLVATATLLMNLVVPLWAASLIVTAAFLIIGTVLIMGAKKKLEANRLKPTRSIETFGEIKNTFQERFHEFKQH